MAKSTYSPAFDIANIMTKELTKVYIVSSIVFLRLSSIAIKFLLATVWWTQRLFAIIRDGIEKGKQ